MNEIFNWQIFLSWSLSLWQFYCIGENLFLSLSLSLFLPLLSPFASLFIVVLVAHTYHSHSWVQRNFLNNCNNLVEQIPVYTDTPQEYRKTHHQLTFDLCKLDLWQQCSVIWCCKTIVIIMVQLSWLHTGLGSVSMLLMPPHEGLHPLMVQIA